MLKWFLVLALVIGLLSPAHAQFNSGCGPGFCSQSASSGGGGGGGSFSASFVNIGGSGAVIEVLGDTASNTFMARTDQYGCYLSTGPSGGTFTAWQQLATTSAMPAVMLNAAGGPTGQSNGAGIGCDSGAVDHSNQQNLWVGINGYVTLSTHGATGPFNIVSCYTQQSNPPAQTQANKNQGGLLAVDPNQSSVAYMSTPTAGLIFTKDQGTNCSTITAVGNGTSVPSGIGGGNMTAFDWQSGTTVVSGQTRTSNIYICTYGTGVYHSSDGGQTWSLMSGSPSTCKYIVAENGVVWVADYSFVPWQYNGVIWSNISATVTSSPVSVTVDETNCAAAVTCHVFFGGTDNASSYSTNGGITWTNAGTLSFVSADVPWVATEQTNFGFFGNSGAAFDTNGHVLTGSEGVYYATPPTSGSAIIWTSRIAGIEEALVFQVVTSPTMSGFLNVNIWDIGCFTLLAQPYSTFPTTSNRGCFGANPSGTLQNVYSQAWASTAGSNIATLADNNGGYAGVDYTGYSGTSTNKGSTWTALTAPSAVTTNGYKGGCMASATASDILWAPTDGSAGAVFPLFTTNGGTTWTAITVSGATVTEGWPVFIFDGLHVCDADKVAAATYYIYNWNTGTSGDAIIKCTSGGASCSVASRPGLNSAFNPNIKAVFGQSGNVFLSTGLVTAADSASFPFLFYPDSGATKNTLTGFTNVTAFGFGAIASGQSYPEILVNGFFNHVWGYWLSTNFNPASPNSATWTMIAQYPLGWALPAVDIDGDKTIPDVFYVGTNSGVICLATSPTYCNGITQ